MIIKSVVISPKTVTVSSPVTVTATFDRVFPWLTLRNNHRNWAEIKAAYQPMKTTYSNGILSVYNRLDFTNLDEYEFKYSIEKDGEK